MCLALNSRVLWRTVDISLAIFGLTTDSGWKIGVQLAHVVSCKHGDNIGNVGFHLHRTADMCAVLAVLCIPDDMGRC
jgi:hypothetical protein